MLEVMQGGNSRRGEGSRSSWPDSKSGIKEPLGMEGDGRVAMQGKTCVRGEADGGDDWRRQGAVRPDEF